MDRLRERYDGDFVNSGNIDIDQMIYSIGAKLQTFFENEYERKMYQQVAYNFRKS